MYMCVIKDYKNNSIFSEIKWLIIQDRLKIISLCILMYSIAQTNTNTHSLSDLFKACLYSSG